MSVKIFFITSILFIGLVFLGPSVYAQVTTVGKEFWVGFMENNRNVQATDVAIIIISANENSKGSIDLSGIVPGRVVTFDLAAGENFTLRLPSDQQDYLHRTSGRIETKGIFISADGDISVYAFNERARSADGTVVLPLQSLGKDYLITSHFEILPDIENYPQTYQNLNVENESLLLVVGVENDTRVQITPTVLTEDGKQPNVPFTITLDQGQSYQLKARGDLTGSRVTVIGSQTTDCKNIAVFGGNKWTGVGQCGFANDHLFQQMYPTNTWGTEFIHVPLAIRTSGELVKVLASENNTQIYIDGVLDGVINAGQFKTYDFNANDVKVIKTSKPSSVTVFAKSQECNDNFLGYFSQGDPFMILYSPNEQMLQEVKFQALNVVEIENNFVSILVKTASKDQTVLDGRNIGNEFKVVPGNPGFSYAVVRIVSGSHTLTNPEGFIGYVYGFGYLESYGYSVGASLNNLNFVAEGKYEFEVNGDQVACLNEEGTWTITPDNEAFQFFIWDFGDGSEPREGKEVKHTYLETGEFTVKIIASISENSCDSQEDVFFEVEIFKIEGQIEGENRVCPRVEEHWYEAIDLVNVSNINWLVDGGEIVQEEESRVLVRWGEPNEEAKLIMIPIGSNGCPGEPFELSVNINEIIEPGLPIGDTNICFDPELIFEYEVDQIRDHRAYTWYIEGGGIVSSPETPSIEVKWNQPDIIGKLWYREYSPDDGLCEGISDPLSIVVSAEIIISINSVQDIICFGDSSGEIDIAVNGGMPPYTFTWSHDNQLNALSAKNLPAGSYQVTITDAQGCKAELSDIILSQSPLLEASIIYTQSTSCFGREDGEARVLIAGGIPPYRTDHANAVWDGDNIQLSGLAMGTQILIVLDALGCQIDVPIEIDSPLPLAADVRMTRPTCPGESLGELLVTPQGGVSPYQYTWDYQQSDGTELIGVPKGIYTVTITDASGCISFGTGEVLEEEPKVRMPSGFRPGDGGVNSIYEGVSNCGLDFHLSVYNRWGELIYSGTKGWDGTVNDVEVMPDVYTYIVKYTYFMDGQTWVKESKGLFTLVR